MLLPSAQSAIAAALRASPLFAPLTVIEDDGTTRDAQEDALATTGVVLVVSPVLALSRHDTARIRYSMTATFAVHLRTSPLVNKSPAGAHLAPHAALPEILRAVTAGNRLSSASAEPITPAAEFAALASDDSGLLTYTTTFEARVTFEA